jgi:hypothetical protein
MVEKDKTHSNEIRKKTLEERKLELEIIELEKPWFKRPAFLVPIIGAFSSIFILWVTGFFNTKIESLETKEEKLSLDTTRLTEIKVELTNESNNLNNERNSLLINTTILSNKLKSISLQNDSIKAILHDNQSEAAKIKGINKNLNYEIVKRKEELSLISDSLAIATKPNLTINLHKIFIYDDMDIGIYITNTGTGTAYFKNVNYYYKGQSFIGSEKDDNFGKML